MRYDGTCIRCAVGACEACDGREPCDCRTEGHPTPTPEASGAKLASLIVTVAQGIAFSDIWVLDHALAALKDAARTPGRSPQEIRGITTLAAEVAWDIMGHRNPPPEEA